MKNLLCENLSENEFDELILMLPRDILIAPFISNYKRFSECFKGFRPTRPASIPEFKIRAVYNKLVFRKEDLKLTDYIYDRIEECVKEHIDKQIDSELLDSLRSLKYNDCDLLKFIDIFYENQIKISIMLYLKIRGINLSKKSIDFINAEIVEREKWKNLASKIESELEEKYIELLKKKDNEVKDLIKQAEAKVEMKCNKIIDEVYSKTRSMIDIEKNEKELTKKDYSDCIEENGKLNKTIDDLKIKIKQKEDIINNLGSDIKRVEKELEDKEKQISELSDRLTKLQAVTMANLIDKETIDEIITSVSELEGKEKLREYYESYTNNSEDGYMKDIWYKWISSEKQIIGTFFDIVISEKKITSSEIERLEDVIYSLNLRILLVKILESISYKYLSMQKYNEVFD